MAEIVSIEGYRQRKLAEAQTNWENCMDRAAELHDAGKHVEAAVFTEKAKTWRKRITSLQGELQKTRPMTHYVPGPGANFSYSFSGADMGYPKVTPTPHDNGC